MATPPSPSVPTTIARPTATARLWDATIPDTDLTDIADRPTTPRPEFAWCRSRRGCPRPLPLCLAPLRLVGRYHRRNLISLPLPSRSGILDGPPLEPSTAAGYEVPSKARQTLGKRSRVAFAEPLP
jgi:hypothetical protein